MDHGQRQLADREVPGARVGLRGLAAAAGLALAVCVATCPALAQAAPARPATTVEATILGTIPSYPGASRPLRKWENPQFAIAMTGDKPASVIAYYIDRLAQSGWAVAPADQAEAIAAAEAGEPAWLTARRSGVGQLDLEVAQGRHPRTGELKTLIYYHSQIKP